jgi:hypothetical protein
MWNKKRLIGLGGLGYTIGGDTMEVKGFMDQYCGVTHEKW